MNKEKIKEKYGKQIIESLNTERIENDKINETYNGITIKNIPVFNYNNEITISLKTFEVLLFARLHYKRGNYKFSRAKRDYKRNRGIL